MSDHSKCKYCLDPEDKVTAPCLHCSVCHKLVHISCLRRKATPGGLYGDVFFIFSCLECSDTGEEIFQRDKMPWFQTVTLVLFDLLKKAEGTGKGGFFHWKIHMSAYIDKHWHILFRKDFKRKKKWIGTVSGILSVYSPHFFQSGTDILQEGGWWRPTFPYLSPEIIVNLSTELTQVKRRQRHLVKSKESLAVDTDDTILSSLLVKYNYKKNYFDIYNLSPSTKDVTEYQVPTNSSICDVKAEPLNRVDSKVLNQEYNVPNKRAKIEEYPEEDFTLLSDSFGDTSSSLHHDFFTDSLDEWISEPDFMSESFDLGFRGFDNIDFSSSEIPEVDGSTSSVSSFDVESNHSSEESKISEYEQIDVKPEKTAPKSLFNQTSSKNVKPWENEEHVDSPLENNTVPMTEYEESTILYKLIQTKEELPKSLLRLRAKLRLRKLKRERNLPVFNIDNLCEQLSNKSYGTETKSNKCHLDRYRQAVLLTKANILNTNEDRILFSSRIVGCNDFQPFLSPYTNRILKPFIRKDFESEPVWLKVLNELQITVKRKAGNSNFIPENASIDYCYIRPEHIPAINTLCELFFWPGIDMTEALQYPDFTCVVLYKKIIIGFACMIPDVGHNESYISFILTRPEWRRCGIATFMIYHLVQTCMGKDVTLHVSATNPAVILYQKFGFKVEEFIQDFYEKYMPAGNHECKHALFLRLSR